MSGPYAELNVGRFFSRKSGPFDGAGVQKLGGSGGMPPRKILKNRDQKTEFGDISSTKAPLAKCWPKICILSTHYSYTLYITT